MNIVDADVLLTAVNQRTTHHEASRSWLQNELGSARWRPDARSSHRGSAVGNLLNDAYLAALALEHGGRVVTFDRDFARFEVPIVVPGA